MVNKKGYPVVRYPSTYDAGTEQALKGYVLKQKYGPEPFRQDAYTLCASELRKTANAVSLRRWIEYELSH